MGLNIDIMDVKYLNLEIDDKYKHHLFNFVIFVLNTNHLTLETKPKMKNYRLALFAIN